MEEEFIKYKESPEFKLLNSHIDLDEFKFYFMEWIHRLWGRAIGAVLYYLQFYFAVSKNFRPC
ncbi:ASN_HP2_G0015420.mRNA.1.CDS.1 [Saccharomyces cerevisiae]|nr:ASN_HP2_G0015420.mRNA.1.CDS.1 [Saccharomyces cerevisiae]CAI6555907.1 ASN_HP2_G0015420.mRNA.1.CDS.1 [Saccharomyces cerevisiae]